MLLKRKRKFNFVDALILLVILAVLAVLFYVFVWSEKNTLGASQKVHITYVVEINGIETDFKDTIKTGMEVVESSKKMAVGTVTAVDTQQYTYLGTDILNDSIVLNPVDDLITQYVTIEADATLSGITYSIDGYPIFVGTLVYMQFPDMVCSGYCISLDVNE